MGVIRFSASCGIILVHLRAGLTSRDPAPAGASTCRDWVPRIRLSVAFTLNTTLNRIRWKSKINNNQQRIPQISCRVRSSGHVAATPDPRLDPCPSSATNHCHRHSPGIGIPGSRWLGHFSHPSPMFGGKPTVIGPAAFCIGLPRCSSLALTVRPATRHPRPKDGRWSCWSLVRRIVFNGIVTMH